MGSKKPFYISSAFVDGIASVFNFGAILFPIQSSNHTPQEESDIGEYFDKVFDYIGGAIEDYGQKETQTI
jgi:hypothetical protein